MPLTKKSSAGDFISDFRKSDAPQFAGKSKEKRTQMAVAAYLAKRRDNTKKVDEKKGPKIDPAKMAAHLARNKKPKKMTSTQKSLASIRQRANDEEVELDEISKKKLGQYVKHATSDVSRMASRLGNDYDKKTLDKLTKRQVGIHKAVDKLTNSFSAEGKHGPEGEKGPFYKDFNKEFEKKKIRMTRHIAMDKKAAMEAVDPSDTGGKEETDMAMGQLKFMQHAIEGIMARVQKDGDMEEWFQNKLTKAHEDLKSLYAYSKGEQD